MSAIVCLHNTASLLFPSALDWRTSKCKAIRFVAHHTGLHTGIMAHHTGLHAGIMAHHTALHAGIMAHYTGLHTGMMAHRTGLHTSIPVCCIWSADPVTGLACETVSRLASI
jgi:hypothetical protein